MEKTQHKNTSCAETTRSVHTLCTIPDSLETKADSIMVTISTNVEERAVFMLAICETCCVVARINGFDMSLRRVAERKCPHCGGSLSLPQELMEMFILYGNFIPEAVGASIALGTMLLQPHFRADFVAAAMNELFVPFHTDYVYDIALPKRQEGLEGDLVVGGFIDFDDKTESPAVAAKIITVGDVLVAINKKSVTSSSFEKSVRMLSIAPSPVYLTFRRSQPVALL